MPPATKAIDDEYDAPDQPDGNVTPSYPGSCVMSGISRAEANNEIYFEPSWEGNACTDGVWEHATRGHGETIEDDEHKAALASANGHTGHFDVFAGNWGGKWKNK